MSHKPTGRSRGRPRKIPMDIGAKILASLRRRVDPETGLVRPRWRELGREFGISRSSVSRIMPALHASGLVESVLVKVSPKISVIYYRLK